MPAHEQHLNFNLEPQQIVLSRKYIKAAQEKPRKCMNPNCATFVKKKHSHLLQRKGIINNITDKDNRVVAFRNDDFEKNMVFEKKGYDDCFKENLLCPQCDNKLFSAIESKEPNFSQIQTFLLFSLRALLWEIRKNEIWVDATNSLFSKKLYPTHIMQEKLQRNNMRLKAMYPLMNTLFNLKDHNDNTIQKYFTFKYKIINKLDIALTSATSLIFSNHIIIKSIPIFYHVLPLKHSSIIAIFMPKDQASHFERNFPQGIFYPAEVYKNFNEYDEEKLLSFVNDLMIYFCEDWICSPSFYQNYIQQKAQKLIDEKVKSLNEVEILTDFKNKSRLNLFN